MVEFVMLDGSMKALIKVTSVNAELSTVEFINVVLVRTEFTAFELKRDELIETELLKFERLIILTSSLTFELKSLETKIVFSSKAPAIELKFPLKGPVLLTNVLTNSLNPSTPIRVTLFEFTVNPAGSTAVKMVESLPMKFAATAMVASSVTLFIVMVMFPFAGTVFVKLRSSPSMSWKKSVNLRVIEVPNGMV